MTINDIFVQISRLQPCLLAFSLAIPNFAAFCTSGTPEQELSIMYASIGPLEMKLSKENITSSTNHFCKVIESIYHLCILNSVCLSNL